MHASHIVDVCHLSIENVHVSQFSGRVSRFLEKNVHVFQLSVHVSCFFFNAEGALKAILSEAQRGFRVSGRF